MTEPKRAAARFERPSGPLWELPADALPCGGYPFDRPLVEDRIYCYGGLHARARRLPVGDATGVDGSPPMETLPFGPCPTRAAEDVRARLASERERFAGTLSTLRREGGDGWDGFDVSEPTVRLMFDAMRAFAAGRPPERGVYLRSSGFGRGKTRLMLAAYFDLLAAGIDARWTTPGELRRLFVDRDSRDPKVFLPADAACENIQRASAVFLDDVGMPGDERFVGRFREDLHDMLESSGAVWCVSTNLDSAELQRNPDVGPANLSRLVRGAIVVVVDGWDWRIGRAEKAGM
jgi:hypothetical protein